MEHRDRKQLCKCSSPCRLNPPIRIPPFSVGPDYGATWQVDDTCVDNKRGLEMSTKIRNRQPAKKRRQHDPEYVVVVMCTKPIYRAFWLP